MWVDWAGWEDWGERGCGSSGEDWEGGGFDGRLCMMINYLGDSGAGDELKG